MSNLIRVVQNGLGFATIQRLLSLEIGILSNLSQQIRRNIIAKKLDKNTEGLVKYVKKNHMTWITQNREIRIFVYIEAYNQIYSLFNFNNDTLTFPLDKVLHIYENGIHEEEVVNHYLFNDKQSIMPNFFFLALINRNKNIEFKYTYRAYHILSRYLESEDPIELKLCTSEDEVKSLIGALVKQDKLEIINGIPVPTHIAKNKPASQYASFPSPSFNAFKAYPRQPDNKTIATVIPRPSRIDPAHVKHTDICIKLHEFHFPCNVTAFSTRSRTGVQQTRVDEKLNNFIKASQKSSRMNRTNDPQRFVLVLKNLDEEARLLEFQHCHYSYLNRLQSVVLWIIQAITKLNVKQEKAIVDLLNHYEFSYCIASELKR